MEIRLLTGEEQLAIFSSPNPIELMKEYVSYTKDLWTAASYKDVRLSYKKGHEPAMLERLQEMEKHLTERQRQCANNMTHADVSKIYHHHGPIYSGILQKMLDTFPKDISKNLLQQYVSVESVSLSEKVRIKALEVLGKEAKDIILHDLTLTLDIFNQLLKTFSKEEVKDILISMVKDYHCHVGYCDAQWEILKAFSDEELKDILKSFIEEDYLLEKDCYLKLFEIFPLEETKELLEKAIKNDSDIYFSTLKKIVEVFPKEEAKELIDAFWKTSPGYSEYDFEEKEEIAKLLKKKK